MKKSDPQNKLAALLEVIQDTALQIHENSEKAGIIPLFDFERCILPDNRRFDNEIRSSLLWYLLLFTQPRLVTQKNFQTSLTSKLPTAESSLIVRQMMCRPPKVWSYRKSYKRGFAHTLAGPDAHCEISITGCINANGLIEDADHLYAFGWTVSFDENIYLICARQITQEQVYRLEKSKPFPMPQLDDDFWEESLFEMLRNLYEAVPQLTLSTAKTDLTEYSPERRFARLNKIILGTLSSSVVRATSALQITVAKAGAEDILSAVEKLVTSNVAGSSEPGLSDYLTRRVLEAVGCDRDGNMPHAHVSLLNADPVALLLLPSELPLFEEVGPRDSIRQALAFDAKTGSTEATRAFEIYQRERRWLSAFPCFDFAIEDHASKFGIPVDAIQTIFDPALMKARLPMAPQGEILKQLQNKFGFYLPDAEPPTFRQVLDALTSRSFQKSGNMSGIVQWIMNCCDRWRYCLCEIEPDMAQRTLNRANQELLHKGLKGLSDMFRKVKK